MSSHPLCAAATDNTAPHVSRHCQVAPNCETVVDTAISRPDHVNSSATDDGLNCHPIQSQSTLQNVNAAFPAVSKSASTTSPVPPGATISTALPNTDHPLNAHTNTPDRHFNMQPAQTKTTRQRSLPICVPPQPTHDSTPQHLLLQSRPPTSQTTNGVGSTPQPPHSGTQTFVHVDIPPQALSTNKQTAMSLQQAHTPTLNSIPPQVRSAVIAVPAVSPSGASIFDPTASNKSTVSPSVPVKSESHTNGQVNISQINDHLRSSQAAGNIKLEADAVPNATAVRSPIRKRVQSQAQNQGEYTCDTPGCGKTFGKKFNLKAHKRVHTGDEPFECSFPLCGKRFKWKSSLTFHEGLHLNAPEESQPLSTAATSDTAQTSVPSVTSPPASHIPSGSSVPKPSKVWPLSHNSIILYCRILVALWILCRHTSEIRLVLLNFVDVNLISLLKTFHWCLVCTEKKVSGANFYTLNSAVLCRSHSCLF